MINYDTIVTNMAAEQGQETVTRQDYFFKLPNEILSMICLHLSLRDMARCMRLCRRFKTILSSRDFRKDYLKSKVSFVQVNKDGAQHKLTRFNLDTLLNKWYCNWDDSDEMPGASDPTRYIFRPFPKMWSNGIVTPANFEPFAQDCDYNSFNRALYLLLKLRRMCRKFQVRTMPICSDMNSVPDICLFPWSHDNLPTPRDVLEIFNAHEVLAEDIDDVHVAEELGYMTGFRPSYIETEVDFEFYIQSLNNTFSKIKKKNQYETQLFQWLHKLFQPSLMFSCGTHSIEPQLYFHLTVLSPGWVGGIFTIVRLNM